MLDLYSKSWERSRRRWSGVEVTNVVCGVPNWTDVRITMQMPTSVHIGPANHHVGTGQSVRQIQFPLRFLASVRKRGSLSPVIGVSMWPSPVIPSSFGADLGSAACFGVLSESHPSLWMESPVAMISPEENN
ncbi:hypothetical protein MPTK1_2g13140 [Marchantia polymorpha subsp. ruderalis]|uniref:Uncharacterized protein n=1 Tax=Marchantia polymorpha TaxID=3197 RepID=A0A2R6XAP2_MARPO|nr:hypothetical protein MARPO_0026s0058 [Marchantia polymorpha]BBN02143.1 hypothetical protein Mp_2g13140 [Marchantia polymorpha subsp. ruderalis]|eukprot:PTQ43177.1 hypothetical protein MARPO_0026s0058 [Marchantia polymorpha]